MAPRPASGYEKNLGLNTPGNETEHRHRTAKAPFWTFAVRSLFEDTMEKFSFEMARELLTTM